jgi:hypothetical protein
MALVQLAQPKNSPSNVALGSKVGIQLLQPSIGGKILEAGHFAKKGSD